MLTHVPVGPLPDGSYAVGYPTPGCSVMTVVSTGMTKERAQEEAARLNEEQERGAAAIERDRQLRMRLLPAGGWRSVGFSTSPARDLGDDQSVICIDEAGEVVRQSSAVCVESDEAPS